MNNAQSTSQKVVAWARPVYARPVNTPDTGEWDEVVDIEFHNRPEKPEGEGWRPLVLAALAAREGGCVVSKHHESYDAMEKFVNEHLRELCAELVEWQDTGLLRQGRLRELAALCTFTPDGQLRLAERMTEHAAIRAIADAAAQEDTTNERAVGR